MSRSRLAWLVVSEGYVYHAVKKLALFNEITINILITIIIDQHDFISVILIHYGSLFTC